MSGEILLAASLDDQGMFATELRSGAIVAAFEEGSAQPNAFGVVGSSSNFIFAVQERKALWNVWTWGEKKPCYRATLPEKSTAMTFSSDAVFCFAGATTGNIYVWQVGTGCLLRCWPAHFREVTQLLVSQDDSFLFSASADSTIHAYNIADVMCEANPRPFRSWSGHSLSVTSLALMPGRGLSQTLVSGSLDRSVRVWDVGTGRVVNSFTVPAPVRCVSANLVGSEILCACGDGELRSLSFASRGGIIGHYTGHSGAVVSCTFNVDGTWAASCSEVDRVRLWETRTRQCVSQVHASRNVRLGGVRIVRRPADSAGIPSFQPFQRILTAPAEAPPVPLRVLGRVAALDAELERRSCSKDFVDRVLWAERCGMHHLADAATADERLAESQAECARWAKAAAALLEELKVADRALAAAGVVVGTGTGPAVGVAEQAVSSSLETEVATRSVTPDPAPPPLGKQLKKRRRA